MKRIAAVFSILFVLAFLTLGPALAQRGEPRMMAPSDSMPGPRMGMMQGRTMQDAMMGRGMMRMMGGIHRRMMQNPMHRSMMSAFVLPALADTLGLSEKQVSRLEELRNEMETQRQEMRQEMMANRQSMMDLFQDGGQPAPQELREQLSTMAEMRADHRATMYERAQQMREVLTDDQREMLDGMTPQQYVRQMMSAMPMTEMMQMMRSMRGGMMGPCMMQGAPMMRQGMMQQGMGQQGGKGMMQRRQNRPNQ